MCLVKIEGQRSKVWRKRLNYWKKSYFLLYFVIQSGYYQKTFTYINFLQKPFLKIMLIRGQRPSLTLKRLNLQLLQNHSVDEGQVGSRQVAYGLNLCLRSQFWGKKSAGIKVKTVKITFQSVFLFFIWLVYNMLCESYVCMCSRARLEVKTDILIKVCAHNFSKTAVSMKVGRCTSILPKDVTSLKP